MLMATLVRCWIVHDSAVLRPLDAFAIKNTLSAIVTSQELAARCLHLLGVQKGLQFSEWSFDERDEHSFRCGLVS